MTSVTLKKLLKKWPGKKTFGVYRFLPLFFVLGAGIEFFMIKLKVGEVNFYNTYKAKRIEELVEEKLKNLSDKNTVK